MKNKIFQKQSVTLKIFWIILLLVLPLNIISILTSLELFNRYAQQIQLSMKNITDVYMNTIDFHTEKADLYLYELLNNDLECAILKSPYSSDFEYENAKYRCHNTLSDQMEREEIISGYFLVAGGKHTDCILALKSDLTDFESLQIYINDSRNCDNKWHLASINGQNLLIRLASEKNFYYGAIVNLDSVQAEMKHQGRYDSQTIFFSENTPNTDKEHILASSVSSRMDVVLSMEVSQKECYRGLPYLNQIFIAVAFLFVIAVPLIYIYMRRLVIQPLNELNKGFHEIKTGNRTYTILKSASTPEFQEAYHSFNEMVTGMENLRIDNMEKELEKNKLELDNLKLQIRPHFLLNTFNLMYYLLKAPDGVNAARKLILYLSDYFRYLFRNDHDVELFDKELALIQGYVEVTQIRYPDGLSIIYDIDPEIRLVRVPPLLIHNFIENVVKHALSAGKCIHIVLAAHYENGWVTFEISDDGNGMPAEFVEKINHRSWTETDQEHLGIRNSIRRIEYIYGKSASVTVESELGEGTTFTISIPYELEGI